MRKHPFHLGWSQLHEPYSLRGGERIFCRPLVPMVNHYYSALIQKLRCGMCPLKVADNAFRSICKIQIQDLPPQYHISNLDPLRPDPPFYINRRPRLLLANRYDLLLGGMIQGSFSKSIRILSEPLGVGCQIVAGVSIVELCGGNVVVVVHCSKNEDEGDITED